MQEQSHGNVFLVKLLKSTLSMTKQIGTPEWPYCSHRNKRGKSDRTYTCACIFRSAWMPYEAIYPRLPTKITFVAFNWSTAYSNDHAPPCFYLILNALTFTCIGGCAQLSQKGMKKKVSQPAEVTTMAL